MNAQQSNHINQPQQNPLATIFFIFGALHAYSSVKTDRRNNWQLVKTGMQILTPVFLLTLTVFLLGTALVEGIEILVMGLS